jgi:hypothetical protein
MSASASAPAHRHVTLASAFSQSASTRAASSAYSSRSMRMPSAETDPEPPCLRMIDSSATMKQSGEKTSP